MIRPPFALLKYNTGYAAQTKVAGERQPDGAAADNQNRRLEGWAR